MLRAVVAALVASAVTLGGVYLMLQSFGDQLDRELDEEVTRVERSFERDLDGLEERFRRQLRRELDARSGAAVTPVP